MTTAPWVLAGLPALSIAAVAGAQPEGGYWRGVHLMISSSDDVAAMTRLIEGHLAPMGVNALVLEMDYSYQFESHPELNTSGLSKSDARTISAACRDNGIRLIPLMNCLGHQSWKADTGALLQAYPEFEEPPEIPITDPNFYCQSWCPQHPDVNQIAFDLMDELLDAFEADAFHIGMDEVFVIASDNCPRCKGEDPAKLFARAVNDYHKHLVGERGVEMLMWGDRFLDAEETGYGVWEAAGNGTAPSIDMVPTDIIMCDWHYEVLDRYPSLKLFQEKGFRVWPGPWRNVEAANRLIAASKDGATEMMLGVLSTGWSSGGGGKSLLRALEGDIEPDEAKKLESAVGHAEVLKVSMDAFAE